MTAKEKLSVLSVAVFAFGILHSAFCIATPAAAYIQNGLVACWDGVENAGVGVHDASATVWKDLVAGREFSLYDVTVGENRMTFAGAKTSYGSLNAADTEAVFLPATNGTVEVVYASKHAPGWRDLAATVDRSSDEWLARPAGTWGIYQTAAGKRFYLVQRDSKYDKNPFTLIIMR